MNGTVLNSPSQNLHQYKNVERKVTPNNGVIASSQIATHLWRHTSTEIRAPKDVINVSEDYPSGV